MDRRLLGKRIVSLVLALELSLSPVAMARVADPAQILAIPETPMGDEVQAQDLPETGGGQAQDLPGTGGGQAKTMEGDPIAFSKVRIKSNLSIRTDKLEDFYVDDDWNFKFINSYYYRMNSADAQLNVEVTSDEEELTGTLWGTTFVIEMAKDAGRVDGDDSRYTYLPGLLGARVPDMEFSGYNLVTVNGVGSIVDSVRPLLQEDGAEEVLEEAPSGIMWGRNSWDSDPASSCSESQLVKLQSGYDTVVVSDVSGQNDYLPIAAWFEPSGKAMLTALDITSRGSIVENTTLTQVYTQDPLAVEDPTTAALFDFTARPEGNKAGTEFETREMWIQVGQDQTALDLHFQTYEPYYSYTQDGGPAEDAACPVSVTYSMDGGSARPLALTPGAGESGNLTCQFLPRPGPFEGQAGDCGTNTSEDKARGDWLVTGIPLTGTGTASNPRTVDITLTVTAPNGEATADYVIHVQRRHSVSGDGMHTLAYGNTPFGMIGRDDSDKWNETVTKALAKTRFEANNMSFSDVATRPTGDLNQQGGIYYTYSYFNCWPERTGNIDLDDTAIVAYQDMMFQDPGVTFTDSFGRQVDLKDALYEGTVTRTIKLQTPKSGALSADSWTLMDALTETCWYNVVDGKPTLTPDNEKAAQVLTSLTQEVDLRGLVVLPGIYDILYVYTDPLTDATTPASGNKPSYTDSVIRKLVVLPIPGDVDMDGAVTTADAYAMSDHLSDWARGDVSERVKLAVRRVFDVNGDGILSEKDCQDILNGYQPELLRSGPVSDYFYLPLPQNGTGYTRRTWDQVNKDVRGTLTLEFLGVEQGTPDGEYTTNPQGPFEPKKVGGKLASVALKNPVTGEDNSVFWMGVKLENSPLNGKDIEDFTLTLTYDSRYVEPARVYTASDKSSYVEQAGSSRFDGWSYTLRKYNIRNTANEAVIWNNSVNSYEETGSVSSRSYQTHYSKVIGELENAGSASNLRELVVTLRYNNSGNDHVQVRDGYLLVVPFKLKTQPPQSVNSNVRLIELGAGMRDLTLVTTTQTRSFLASLFNVGEAPGTRTTSAFSAQDGIYGNSTQNLRDGLRYEKDSGEVPIGEDNTTRTTLVEATYGDSYYSRVNTGPYVTVVEGLPPGLTYNATYGQITGTPLLPGTYDFEINGSRYRIEVKPRTIQYRPMDAQSYYGESEYRGTVAEREERAKEAQQAGNSEPRNFRFVYNASDLSPADRIYAKKLGFDVDSGNNWRDGAELERILNREVEYDANVIGTGKCDYTYTAPGFTAYRDEAGNPVLASSLANRAYTIDVSNYPSSTCYTLTRSETAALTVVPRPVYVDHINATAADSGRKIYNDEQLTFSGAILYDKVTGGETTTEIILSLPILENGLYNNLPLTGEAKREGDRVAVTYSGIFLYDTAQGDSNDSFQLNAQQEERPIQADQVTLRSWVTENGQRITLNSDNYALVDRNVQNKAASDIRGIVVLRGVAALEMTRFPAEFGAGEVNYYGGKIKSPEGLKVRATLGEGSSSTLVGEYDYNSPSLLPLLIHYNWVSPEEYAEGIKEENKTSLVGTGVDLETFEDTHPYGYSRGTGPDGGLGSGYRDNYLYPDMNGWRICACVTQFVGDEEGAQGVQYIKCYSGPITVRPKPLTITVKSARRFYGEELRDDQLDYTFDTTQLVTHDSVGVTRGTKEALEMVFGRLNERLESYGVTERNTLPKMRAVDDKGNPATAATPIVAGSAYKIVISEASSPCYAIQYTVNDGEKTSISTKQGSAPLTIQPRPIIVQSIRGNEADGNFTNIYADTKNLVVTKDWKTGATLVTTSDTVDFRLPTYDSDRGTTSYYTATSDGNMYTDRGCTFPAGTTNALVTRNGIVDDVQVQYQIRFLPDKDHYTWAEFTQGFFDNDTIVDAPAGYLNKNIQVEKMDLVGKDRGNYVMVFADDTSFQDRVPADAVANAVQAPANNGRPSNKLYYVSGTGRVYLRPIQNIVISSLGQMSYTYGDQFAPNQAGVSGNAMTVRVEYDKQYDNDPANNFNAEDVVYSQLRVDENGQRISTFAARGFTIYYAKPGQTREEAETLEQVLTSGEVMVPGTHHGATLFVTGKRSVKDPLVYSQYAAGQEEPLKVSKATLTLTATDAHKFYGESNPTGDYSFTFDTRQLVRVDQDALKALKGTTSLVNYREGTKADLSALDKRANFGGLTYTTDATAASGVGANGKWGEYDLKLTAADPTSVLTNYNVVTQSAHLYVYPRPIYVTKINSSASDPVYTIFNDSNTFHYDTQLSTAARAGLQPRVEVACGARASIYPVDATNSGDGKRHELPITTTLGLYGNDTLIFNAAVDFPSTGWTLDNSKSDVSLGVEVTISPNNGLVETIASRNYFIPSGQGSLGEQTSTPGASSIWGSAKLRTIKSIAILSKPIKLEYTYGEPLDLTGLQVQVVYAQMDQESAGSEEHINVEYIGPQQFQSMGLYVNYWTPGRALPDRNDERRALPETYPKAYTGDHVTIAPTHQTQGFSTSGTTPTTVPFAANGKYLVISGFQKAVTGDNSGSSQIAAAPVILGEYSSSSGGYYHGTPTPIKVNPLKLRYTLSAQDKTYDGNKEAAGSLTLTNVYVFGSDPDVVYVPMGASYESNSTNHNNFAAFKQKVENGRVTFTTGTYTENGEAPLENNGKITWADGYIWGKGLTFTFPNPNVHYVDDSGVSGVGDQDKATYWKTSQSYEDVTRGWDSYKAVTAMPVEVTNMVLAGPDAANYTWDWDSNWTWSATNGRQVSETQVLITTRASTVDGQAATPFATIHKANRAPIQSLKGYSGKFAQLLVDRATNVVRLLLEQELSKLENSNNAAGTTDEFRDELHFEYALLYAQTDEDGNPTGLLAQWAGADGQKDYQDTTFFGGEAVTPTATAAGYQPAVDRLPKIESRNENTIYKGQVYQWADLDNGVVTVAGRTHREDSGFVLDPSAYPGGAILVDRDGNEIKAEDAYWYYTLYSTDRVNLPRDTVFYPLVRLAETHNYNASGNLSGDKNVTAALLDAAQKALDVLADDNTEENLAAAKAASQAVLDAAGGMKADAQAAAQAQMDFDAELGSSSKWPETQPAPLVGPASAIKTLTQRLDLTSASSERSQDTTDTADYLVELLEAVWFTDTLVYEEEKYFSAAVYNHPTRYYGYYWDVDRSARLEFNQTALSFTEELLIPVRMKLEDGSTVETDLLVNTIDNTVGGRVAKIYVQVNNNIGNRVRAIQILPTALYARLGDEPYQLSWATDPEKPSNRNFRWTTSDPAVATVDENGLVTFRGVGTCTITLASDNQKYSTITVTVSEVLPLVEAAKSIFDAYRSGAWMELDEEGNFYPTLPMTRAQAVELLDLFLDPNGQWSATTELFYLDVTGEEKYADALRRMTGAGVVVGLPGSTFGGSRLISRAEFATMVTRMLRLDTPDTSGQAHQFLDAGEEDTWAYRYIDALGMTGVTRGTGGGNFAPGRDLTREEAAAIIARLLTVRLGENQPGLVIPADMTPANWSYQYVLQAVNTIAFPAPVVEPPATDA